MKKILCLLASLIMVFSLTACTKREVKYAKEPEFATADKGEWIDGVYKNDFANLSFTLPEGWIAATEESLKTLEETEGLHYDMMCQDGETGTQIMVMLEELLLTGGTAAITEDEYLDNVANAFYNQGLMVSDSGEMELCGENYKYIEVYGEDEDFSVNQRSIIRKKGNIMISIIAVSFNGKALGPALENFR